MESQTGRIVVGYDGSPLAAAALDWAAAEAESRGLPLTVLHVLDNPNPMLGLTAPPPWLDQDADAVREVSAEGAARARKIAGSVDVRGLTVIDGVARTLIDSSRDAALLVVGTRGRGDTAGALLGSVAFAVSSHARCPVMVVRGDSTRPSDRNRPVVVGVDGSAAADVALEYAAYTAARAAAPLIVVSSYSSTPVWGEAAVYTLENQGGPTFGSLAQEAALKVTAAAAATARAKYPDLFVRERAIEGRPAQALASAAVGGGLLVVGSRGHGGFAGLLLGSVSHGVIHCAPCPVAIVRRDTVDGRPDLVPVAASAVR